MYQSRKLFITFVCFCFTTICTGQDINDDFEIIGKKMEGSQSVNLEVDIKVYSKRGASLIYSSKATALKMGDNSTKSILAEMEYLQTSEYELKLDHEEKAILIFKKAAGVKSTQQSEEFEFDVEKLKELLKGNNQSKLNVSLLSNSNSIKKYSIKGLAGIKEVQLSLNANEGKLISVVYEYGTDKDPGQYIVLKYTKFDYNTDLSIHFDLKKYFTIVSGEYILNAKFKDYHLYTEK